ncbi:TRAPP trafficking subunit Trs65-domain-containing protein [Annulohypoxylon maeteangense]|uniref:TRAPP trafficking subunit Trs65-domain-containing protein n=1 Tax=Annulohypoxylon maeteangense TaxID=1927788 RepID=UPI00200754A2|nr:TRAPP trafficking subunit Trs65-domain-containing protein [Annulohypoxylon maeteangense]KAI0889260.1 TRAPP trafficking subunit Trs65-domain-containing protein [Annulohypoxylon maeteangense]
MSDPFIDTTSKTTVDLLDDSSLTYFIPLTTDFKVEDAFRNDIEKAEEPFSSVERRESLFFDESVDIYLVLKCSYVEQDILRSSLRSLVISVETQIVNGTASDRDGQPPSEIISTGTVGNDQDPTILIGFLGGHDDQGEEDSRQYTVAVWKHSVFISRPRMRLQSPSVVFTATAGLKPTVPSLLDRPSDAYLPSGVASGLNLLGSFGNDPAMNGIKPRLSALRVSRVAPVTHQDEDALQPIKSLSKLSLRIYPAAHSRMRFTHLNTTPSTATVLAMLEVDFTPFFECEIILDKISISVADGLVEDLTSQAGMPLPVSCVAHDHVTFLYRLSPADAEVVSKNPIRELKIAISAMALLRPDVCTPRLSMAWTATVDFTIPVNPGYGSTMQPIQRMHRPSQLSIGGESTISLTAPSVARPDSLPSLEASTRAETSVPDMGITMTFTSPYPDQQIFPGDEFVWNVFVVNRSPAPSAIPRKLAIVVVPKRRRNESRVNRPPSVSRLPEVSHGQFQQSKMPKDRSVADAILDENVVHAMQHSSIIDSAEVVCLSADVRVGPLAPGACHVAELKFLALKEGIVSVEAVRVIDLANNEHVDIRELPTVIVKGKHES